MRGYPRRNKFGAVPTFVDGIRFASKKEASRYQELKLLLRAGVISDLKLQVPFPIVVNGMKICKYVADFTYLDENKNLVVSDAKGILTPTYRLKKKLVAACYGVKIVES